MIFIVQLFSGIIYVGVSSLNKIIYINLDKKNGL